MSAILWTKLVDDICSCQVQAWIIWIVYLSNVSGWMYCFTDCLLQQQNEALERLLFPHRKNFLTFLCFFWFIATCYPKCKNGGKCLRPGKCRCQPGYGGRYCHKGELILGCFMTLKTVRSLTWRAVFCALLLMMVTSTDERAGVDLLSHINSTALLRWQ